MLRKLVDNSQQFFGGPVSIDPLSEIDRPFSTVLRARVIRDSSASADNPASEAFVKILKPRGMGEDQVASMRLNVVRDFEMTNRVSIGLAPYIGLGAVKPIACFPEELALVTEAAPGTPLSELLLRRSAGWPASETLIELTSIVRRVGTWLRAVQASVAVAVESSVVSPDTMRSYLDRRLTELEQSKGLRLTSEGRKAIERYYERLLSEVVADEGRIRAVWIHADFCPENILADPTTGQITVLDFTMAKTGTIYHDLAHLYMQLDLMMTKPWFRHGVIARLQRALLDSFQSGLEATQPLFALMFLQHVICHVVALQPAPSHPLSRFYGAQLHRRHRRWLSRVAGLDARSWTR